MTMRIRKVRSDKITFSRKEIYKIEKMAALGLTLKQISSVFSISPDTLRRRANENDFNLSAALTKGKTELETKLGNKAIELALAGNTSMLKYVLGCRFAWTEKQQITIEEEIPTIEETGKQKFQKSLDDLTHAELVELENLTNGFISFEDKVEKRLKIKNEESSIQDSNKLN
jgi:hypothetical protein